MSESGGLICVDCGGVTPPFGRFCSRCGVAVDAPDLMLDPLGTAADESLDEAIVGDRGYGSPETDWRVVGGIATLALALVVWLVLRTPITTLDGVAEALAVAETAGRVTDDVGTAALDEDETFVTVELDGVARGQPVLGEELGLRLYAASPSRMTRIDLDTGEVAVSEVDGQPVAIWRDQLVLLSDQQILAVPLGDLAGEARLVYDLPVNSSADLSELFFLGGDRLVMTFQSFGRLRVNQTYTVVDLEAGDAQTWELPASSFSRFGLVSVPGGGVFDVVDGEFTKVFDGIAISASPDSGLGFSCRSPDDCETLAFDRKTGQPRADLTLPEVDQFWFLQQVPGSDRLLAVYEIDEPNGGASGVRLYDAAAGDYLPGSSPSGGVDALEYFEDPQRMAVWSDRFLAFGLSDAIRIQDVSTGTGWDLKLTDAEMDFLRPSSRLFFMESETES